MSSAGVDEFLRSLEGVEDVSPQWALIEGWAREGRAAFLYEIVFRLEDADAVEHIPEWARSSTSENLVTTLALTPHADFVRYATLLAIAPFDLSDHRSLLPSDAITKTTNRCRGIARRIAASAPPEVLEALFAQYQNDAAFTEYLAVLLHEMVLRGKVKNDAAWFVGFQSHLEEQGHPLSRLPLRPLASEKVLPDYLPTYHARGSSLELPFGPARNVELGLPTREAPSLAAPQVHVKEKNDAPATARITSAVQNWAEASNGVLEARIFSLDPAVSAERVDARLLLGCGLDCLRNADVSTVAVRRVPLESVLGSLFAAAANGGAYNNGLGGAYGRLMAWESVAGISGCLSNDAAAIEIHAQNCHWWKFQASTDWFYRVAWDIGIAALQPHGETLTLMAATDTD